MRLLPTGEVTRWSTAASTSEVRSLGWAKLTAAPTSTSSRPRVDALVSACMRANTS